MQEALLHLHCSSLVSILAAAGTHRNMGGCHRAGDIA